MQDELKSFSGKVMLISAPAISMFGTRLPGMAGGAAGEQGAMTPAADAIHDLKNEVAELNKVYATGQTDEIKKSADAVEGSLLALQSMSVLSEKQTDELIDQLHKAVGE